MISIEKPGFAEKNLVYQSKTRFIKSQTRFFKSQNQDFLMSVHLACHMLRPAFGDVGYLFEVKLQSPK